MREQMERNNHCEKTKTPDQNTIKEEIIRLLELADSRKLSAIHNFVLQIVK